jgi:hypothetical protein
MLLSRVVTGTVEEAPSPLEARNSAAWCEYFQRNSRCLLSIPWDAGPRLTEEQQQVLIPSLQDFQLGESSAGRYGLVRAEAYGKRVGDSLYVEGVRLFFAEEGRHAAYLARYLGSCGAGTIGRSWTDFAFRRVRRLMGLETLLTALLTAELIGEVYYRAVRAATGCPVLRAICTQVLRDERQHVRFHVERFALMHRGRGRLRAIIHRTLWRGLFTAACVAVWVKHGQAFRMGGYPFRRFRTEAWAGFRRAAGSNPAEH